MRRAMLMFYGLLAYALGMASIVYAIGFVGNYWVPKSIDSGVVDSIGLSIVVNLCLLGLFAIQHSVMARPAFKKVLTRIIPEPVERSTYVLLSAVVLGLLYLLWKPMPDEVWHVTNEPAAILLQVIYFLGWGIVVFSTFLISHTDLFGLRQVITHWQGREPAMLSFRTPLLYKFVRHPIYLGFLLAFWATPLMTTGHLLFAIATTIYIFIGATLEERDLIDVFGASYRKYRRSVPMLVPWRLKRGNSD